MASAYAKGYADGFKVGYTKGQEIPSEKLIANDLVYVYGMMCIRLYDIGLSQEEIEDFCEKIQQMWVAEYDYTMQNRELGIKVETLPSKVKRITGIDLIQTFGFDEGVIEND